MSQRGGAVTANLRMADHPVASDLIALGSAEMILSLEPLEALRWLPYLSTDGMLVTSASPVRNISDYPELDELLAALATLPHAVVVEADPIARAAGNGHANNVVLLGAASAWLPLDDATLEACVTAFFAPRGEKTVETNLRAFAAGQAAAAPAAAAAARAAP
jgi:indolepyruvate ferredoxin oxidoreductase beta subunit